MRIERPNPGAAAIRRGLAVRHRPAVDAALRHPCGAARVALVVTYLHWALPRRSLPETVDRLRSRPRVARRRADQTLVSFSAAILRRWPINRRGDCLAQSLVAFHLASRRGLDPRLHCGVKSTQGSINGHAWVTVNGVDLYGTSRDGHLEMLVLPSPADRQQACPPR